MTYSTAAGRPLQLSIGVFEAASNGPYDKVEIPRLEAEAVWNSENGNTKLWAGGLAQTNKSTRDRRERLVLRLERRREGRRREVLAHRLRLLRHGHRHDAECSSAAAAPAGTCGANGADDLRTSYGFIGQVTFTPKDSKFTFAASYGSNFLEASDTEGGDVQDREQPDLRRPLLSVHQVAQDGG